MTSTKGNKVELTTFKSWGKENIIGHKTIEENGRRMVNFIWCKVCARHKAEITRRLKGSTRKSALAFIEGTNVVTKFQVTRHIEGKGHETAIELEHAKPVERRVDTGTTSGNQQRINTLMASSTHDGYLKLFRTAYELALNPNLPLHQFKTLVKVQRDNGVRLVTGHDDSKSCQEFITYIADAIAERVAVVLAGSNFMSILTDGSQARKTGSDKEMVLIRTERNGIPVYFVASLLEMSLWGGTDAESLKNGIDDIFSPTGPIPLGEKYKTKIISCTSDGASVNFGRISGLMTRLSEDRPWLVKIHCTNHRIELAVKDAFKNTEFTTVDDFYIGVHNLLKNSGKIKSEIKEAAQALNIQHYTLSKLTGTRFVGHRRSAYQRLLSIWPAITSAFENVVADPKTRSETRSKVVGYLKKLHSYNFICLVCCYLDVLEHITPASKIFEAECLLPNEVRPTIVETISNLDDTIVADLDDDFLVSHLSSFRLMDDNTVVSSYIKSDDPAKANRNRGRTEIVLDNLTNTDRIHIETAVEKKKAVCVALKALLKEKFSDFDIPMYTQMKWFDPKSWGEESTFGYEEIRQFAHFFEEPLLAASYDETCALREWRGFRNYVRANHHFATASDLWKTILRYKRDEYPNLSLLAELVMCLSGSNSTVERAFSLLTLLLSDRRLRMKHSTMQAMLIIKINDKIWLPDEREDILSCAVNSYLKKRRSKTLSEPPEKQRRRDNEQGCDSLVISDDSDDTDEESSAESNIESSSDE